MEETRLWNENDFRRPKVIEKTVKTVRLMSWRLSL